MTGNAAIRFIPQTGTSQDDENTRKTIRRHVMLGKNRGRTPNPKQPAMQGTAVFNANDWQPHAKQQLTVPRQVGTGLSFVDWADQVEAPLMHDTLLFCRATNEHMFVLAPCIAFSAPDTLATCLDRLACDALYVHVMVFGTQAYLDQAIRHKSSDLRGSCIQHYGKAINILRERLTLAERQPAAISDITVNCVIILAMHALATGQYEVAKTHVAGLGKMMSLREHGMDLLSENKTRLIVDLLRCDISISLATGQPPSLFPGPSHEDIFPLPDFPTVDDQSHQRPFIINHDLAKVWDALGRFCAIINNAALDEAKLPEQLLVSTLASVMYRLLDISVVPDSTDEAIRLAMLSFCASTFLHWGPLRLPFGWLQSEHKRSLTLIMDPHLTGLNPTIGLWLLLMYGITFLQVSIDEHDETKKWLLEAMKRCRFNGWVGVKDAMRRLLWIDIVCDDCAQNLIEAVLDERQM